MPYEVDSEGRVIEVSSETPRKKKASGSSYSSTGTLSLVRVFLYMFAGLLITSGIALGLGALFKNVLGNADIDTLNNAAIAYLAIMITSAIAVLVLSILLNVFLYKGKRLLVPAILYTVFMGVLLSSFTIFIEWSILGLAFGITAGTFGLMALIAFLSKGNLSGLAIAGLGLLIGAMILALVNWILYLVTGGDWGMMNIVISFIVLAAMMLITIYDMWRIKKICETGAMNSNMELYCAFTLYVDFIYILIRIIIIILASKKS
ncbi:MAG: US12 family protein [Bacilli bacterium]|nr:US12 family protein [Bacilli bacterium]